MRHVAQYLPREFVARYLREKLGERTARRGKYLRYDRRIKDQEELVVVEPFRIHITDEVFNDLRTRLHQTRWPEQIPGIGWEQGTELDWMKRLVSYWAHEFDWRAWEHKLNALNHFKW